jgi:23S rRNA pseudouridine2604 synthase
MRINKFLSYNKVCSRREADRLIQQGVVLVNGKKATLGDTIGEHDTVVVHGKKVKRNTRNVYIAYNKPVGVITTTDDNKSDTIIQKIGYGEYIFPVGRLDVETSGLIFLTNDGAFAEMLMRPGQVEKEYFVRVNKSITKDLLKRLISGVDIGDNYDASALSVKKIGSKTFTMVLNEGRNRIVRRMCEAIELDIVQLRRIRIGEVELGDLEVGAWRYLKGKEVEVLKNS